MAAAISQSVVQVVCRQQLANHSFHNYIIVVSCYSSGSVRSGAASRWVTSASLVLVRTLMLIYSHHSRVKYFLVSRNILDTTSYTEFLYSPRRNCDTVSVTAVAHPQNSSSVRTTTRVLVSFSSSQCTCAEQQPTVIRPALPFIGGASTANRCIRHPRAAKRSTSSQPSAVAL